MALIENLQKDQDYKELEALEVEFKQLILDYYHHQDYKQILEQSFKLGLLLKYKPYGVKCSTILGYSIFLLNQDEGFSFQTHNNFKTEVFHFISVHPRGYVFLAEGQDILDKLREHSFEDWLDGKHNQFDRHVLKVKPGDVVKVDRTGVVHTALGCILEEFANTSTDMVDRIFDQNKDRKTEIRDREEIFKILCGLNLPTPKTTFSLKNGDFISKAVEFNEITQEFVLEDSSDFRAKQVRLLPQSTYSLNTLDCFSSIVVFEGELSGFAVGREDLGFALSKTESIILPPGFVWNIKSDITTAFSLLEINEKRAFL